MSPIYTGRVRPDLRLIPEENWLPLPQQSLAACISCCSVQDTEVFVLTHVHLETWNVPGTQGSFKGKNADLLSAQRSRADMASGLVTFVETMWLETLLQTLTIKICFSLSIYRAHLYGRGPRWFATILHVVVSYPDLDGFVPQGDLCMFCCTHGIELIITRLIFTRLECVSKCLK